MSKEKDKLQSKNSSMYCKGCDKDVVPVKKMFNTLLCPNCYIIIDSPTMRQVQGN